MFSRFRSVAAFWLVSLTAIFGATGLATADPLPSYYGQIIVEDVWATPGQVGDLATLRLRIVNEGRDPVHLLGVESPVALDSRIVGRIGDQETANFESVSVRADNDLDLTRDYMWIELGPLMREVKPGESIPLELVFLRSRIQLKVLVRAAGG